VLRFFQLEQGSWGWIR